MRAVRGHAEQETRGALAGAVGDARALDDQVADAARKVAAARGALATAAEARDRALAQGAAAATIAHLERFLRRLRRDLEDVLGALARAEARRGGQDAVVELARARLIHARAEREVIERHFAAWRADRQKLADRRAD